MRFENNDIIFKMLLLSTYNRKRTIHHQGRLAKKIAPARMDLTNLGAQISKQISIPPTNAISIPFKMRLTPYMYRVSKSFSAVLENYVSPRNYY